METKPTSAIIAVGIWLAVVQVFCALLIRDAIKDADTNDELATIAAKLDDLRAEHAAPTRDPFASQRQAEQDLVNGPGWILRDGKEVAVPAKGQR